MDKFDERYDIRLAEISDIADIMHFIDEFWSKRHIMSCDEELFRYEYCDGQNVNFVLAIEKRTGLIEGIFGFIRTSNTRDDEKKYIWGSMWKVNEKNDNLPFLGVELAKRACDLSGCRYHIGNGANQNTTIPLRRLFFGDKTGKMKQYYLLNTAMNDYKIAKIINKKMSFEISYSNEGDLSEYSTIDEVKRNFKIENTNAIPFKDSWYIDKRYFNHPYYKYKVFGVSDSSGKIGALIIGRKIEYNNSSIFRIVDYIGEHHLFAGIGKHLKDMIRLEGLEYIDFYSFGFDEEIILKAGLRLRTNEDPNIIPNYFEPFLQENVDIWVHYQKDRTTFFKADGDQDRPNIIKKSEEYYKMSGINANGSLLLCEDKFLATVDKYLDNIKNEPDFIIWGTDQWIGEFLNIAGVKSKIKYFADNNEKLWGTQKNGLTVLSPEQVIHIIDECRDYKILIGSVHLAEIRNQLLELGVSEDRIDLEGFVIAENYFTYNELTPHKIITSNLVKYERVFNMLNDERSKEVYASLLNFKITLNNEYLRGISEPYNEQYFDKDLISLIKTEIFCDCGSFNGDTLETFINLTCGDYEKYIAIEADKDIYEELNNRISESDYKRIETYNVACWNKKTVLEFQSAQSSGHITESGDILVQADTLDNILKNQKLTFLKMDIEGAEEMALNGGKDLIIEYKPILAICIYHSLDDFQKLPLIMKELDKEYSIFIRHYTDMFDVETVCYAIPKNRII